MKTITNLEQYKERSLNPDGTLKPLIILTSVASMNQGYSRTIIKDFAADKRNEVVFVEIQNSQVPKDSIAARLLQKQQYFQMDEIKAVFVTEKPQKHANDPRSKKGEGSKRRTEIDDLMNETIQKLPKEDHESTKQTKDSTEQPSQNHQLTIAED